MGAITIRQLDDNVIARLKLRAKQHGRSMEEEARVILTGAAEPERLSGQAAVEYFRGRRKAIFGDRLLPDSLDVLREVRDEDPLTSSPDASYR